MPVRTPRYEDVLESQRQTLLRYAADEFDEAVGALSSPIEKVFLGSLLAYRLWSTAFDGANDTFDAAYDTLRDAGLTPYAEDPHDPSIQIYVPRVHRRDWLQVFVTQSWLPIGDRMIRPDFAFVLTGPHATKVIVELDGHDFHERTPEQAQKDKSRDRDLQRLGWHVLRFTGREVLRGPDECTREVESLLIAKAILARQQEREAEK